MISLYLYYALLYYCVLRLLFFLLIYDVRGCFWVWSPVLGRTERELLSDSTSVAFSNSVRHNLADPSQYASTSRGVSLDALCLFTFVTCNICCI